MNTVAADIVLRDEIDQGQALTTLDLYSEEKSLGREDTGLQRITESQVTIGLSTIIALPHSQLAGRGGWDYYILYQPFTLHRLEGERNYQSLVFQVTMDNPSVIAADLFPKDVNVELHIERCVSVTPHLKFSYKNISELGAGAEIETKKSHINLIPIIIAYGEGERVLLGIWNVEGAARVSGCQASGSHSACSIRNHNCHRNGRLQGRHSRDGTRRAA